jgi:hypothetical protein
MYGSSLVVDAWRLADDTTGCDCPLAGVGLVSVARCYVLEMLFYRLGGIGGYIEKVWA